MNTVVNAIAGNTIEVQIACTDGDLPEESEWQCWVDAALSGRNRLSEVCIRIVGAEESAALNQTWRGKSGPTNVLSFDADIPDGVDSDLLGDIVICAPRVAEEAVAQNKIPRAHWAHLTVHGVLHLLGFDHETDDEANVMESRETEILAGLGFADPYL